MSKHNSMTRARGRRTIQAGAVAIGAAAIGIGALSAPASAAEHDWTGVAACESSGNWSTNTGNGFYGGLQFTPSTWSAYGGTAYAARADLATPAQQIAVAEKVLAGQGPGAWPSCGKRLSGGTTAVAAAPQKAAPAAPAPAPAPKAAVQEVSYVPASSPGGAYTVRAGDTLSAIASAQGVDGGWQGLWQLNQATVANPNLIMVGQHLTLG